MTGEKLQHMESLGEDVSQLQLRRGRDFDQLRLSFSNHFMSEVLADINVLGSFPSADDVISPLDACCVILAHWCGRLLSEAKYSDTKSQYQKQMRNSSRPRPLREQQSSASSTSK